MQQQHEAQHRSAITQTHGATMSTPRISLKFTLQQLKSLSSMMIIAMSRSLALLFEENKRGITTNDKAVEDTVSVSDNVHRLTHVLEDAVKKEREYQGLYPDEPLSDSATVVLELTDERDYNVLKVAATQQLDTVVGLPESFQQEIAQFILDDQPGIVSVFRQADRSFRSQSMDLLQNTLMSMFKGMASGLDILPPLPTLNKATTPMLPAYQEPKALMAGSGVAQGVASPEAPAVVDPEVAESDRLGSKTIGKSRTSSKAR
jgi:hypothetical protein